MQKQEIIEILQCKIFINNKWFRLNDAIEDMVDAYIGFLNYTSDQLISFDLSKGILFDDE